MDNIILIPLDHTFDMFAYASKYVLTLYPSHTRYALLYLRYDMPALGKKALKQKTTNGISLYQTP